MTRSLRGYRRAHREPASPLPEAQRMLASGRGSPAECIDPLSERFELPAAAVRSALSYYAEFAAPPDTLRVCQGTSCMLAGAGEIYQQLASSTSCRGVYCLGYCDRGPVVLSPEHGIIPNFSLDGSSPVARREGAEPELRSRASPAIVTRRIARGDFSSLERAQTDGAYRALQLALRRSPNFVIEAIERSGERGRGGAGFPTGEKWRRCAQATGDEKIVVANGDEGDPGSFIDRVLMERDPHAVLEGIVLCGYAVGARAGIVYIRSEYPEARVRMERALAEARAEGLVGPSVLGSDFAFEVRVVSGMGSYVCGEETAMLNAIEGERGEVRLRPPYPVTEGLNGRPTVVQNVETLVNVPWIVEHGAEAYAALGTTASSGTKALCLNHGFARPGIVEVEFGVSLREVIEEEAGGGRGGTRLEAVLLGGPMGSLLLPEEWDVPVCYHAMAECGVRLGHGGLVALPEGTDFRALLLHWLEFMVDESCGKCVPCRLGSQRLLELVRNAPTVEARPRLERLLDVVSQASLCGFGQLMPGPMQQMLAHFGERIFPAGASR